MIFKFLVDIAPLPPIPYVPFPLLLWGCSPTYLLSPSPLFYFPLSWGIKLLQDQKPPLPFLSGKAILCTCVSGIMDPSLPIHSLVGGLVSGSTGWTSKPMLFFISQPTLEPCLLSHRYRRPLYKLLFSVLCVDVLYYINLMFRLIQISVGEYFPYFCA